MDITTFRKDGLKTSIRAVEDELGRALFCANDVANALGYKDVKDALERHCKMPAVYKQLGTKGGRQDTRMIYEPDLYRLIVGSQLDDAVKFERWIFEEVLPSIRKTGEYVNLEMKAQLESLQERHEVLSFHMDEAGKMLQSMGTTYQALYKVEHAILDKLAKAKGGLESKLLADEVIRQTKCSETDYFHAISDLYTRYKIKTDRNGNWALTR